MAAREVEHFLETHQEDITNVDTIEAVKTTLNQKTTAEKRELDGKTSGDLLVASITAHSEEVLETLVESRG